MSTIYHFIKKEEQFIKEINSQVAIYEHQPTGAKLLHVPNDDNNKVFNIEFVTIPKDSTGVAHIIEHSVLCGSENFPLKEPFVNLLKGSLNTFLNAMTFPDKTMYPFASLNEQDFLNILDVYLDAVFKPNIRKNPLTLRQEGWRLEMFSEQEKPKFNGVVFNEMKGAMSSPEEKISQLCDQALYDNTYQFNSGGDPEAITDLTDQAFLDFYKKHYHPSNSYAYLYGNTPLEPVLKALDQKFTDYQRLTELPQLQTTSRLPKPQYLSDTYAGQASDLIYAQLQFVLPKNKHEEKIVTEYALQLVSLALFNLESSKIRQNILESGIAQEVYAYSSDSTFDPSLTIGLVGLKEMSPMDLEQIILDEIKQAVKNFDRAALTAAFNILSFNLREGDSQSLPEGLLRSFSALINWPYGRSPFESLAYEKHLAELNEKLQGDDFIDLIKSYILDNTHRITAILKPDESKISSQKEAEQEKVNSFYQSLSDTQKAHWIKLNKDLQKMQNTPDSAEALATLPILSRADLKEKHDYQSVEASTLQTTQASIPLLTYFGAARGIVYLSYQFSLSEIEQDHLFALSLLQEILGYIDTEKYTFAELTNYSLAQTGGFSTNLFYTDKRSYFEIKIKLLEKQITPGIEIIDQILLHSQIKESEARIYKLLTTLYSRMKSNLSDNGMSLARKRLRAHLEIAGMFDEITSGITFYQKLGELLENWENQSNTFLETLDNILQKLIRQNHLTLFFAGEANAWQNLQKQITQQIDNYPYREPESLILQNWHFNLPNKNEAFMIASDIQYNVAGNNLKQLYPAWQFDGKLYLLRQIINTDYLWNAVRVKGGAYGCSLTIERTGNLLISSYRDPQCKQTYNSYQALNQYLKNLNLDEPTLESYLIGTFAALDQPLSFPAAANRAKNWYDRDISLAILQKERSALLHCTVKELQAYAQDFVKIKFNEICCTVGNQHKIKEDQNLFQEIIHLE